MLIPGKLYKFNFDLNLFKNPKNSPWLGYVEIKANNIGFLLSSKKGIKQIQHCWLINNKLLFNEDNVLEHDEEPQMLFFRKKYEELT